jgi:hypothetical protein
MKKKYIIPSIFLLIIAISSSCLKGNFKLSKIAGSFWEPDVAIPLINSNLSLNEILTVSNANGNFSVGADNLITLVYKGNLFSLMAKDFIQIPNQLLANQASIGNTALINGFNSATVPFQFTFPAVATTLNFNPGTGAQTIDSLKLRNGLLSINLKSYYPQQTEFKITIPNARKNGNVFSQTLSIPPATAPNYSAQNFSFDLSEYKISLIENGLPNKLKVEFETKLIKTSNEPIANTNDKIEYSLNFANLAFQYLYGNIGYQLLAPNKDTVAISIFNNVLSGSINLPDAVLKIKINNSFGVPIRAQFEELTGLNPNAITPIYPFSGPGVTQVLDIHKPTFLGGTDTTNFVLDHSNSNVLDVFGQNTPKYVIYKLKAESNPPPQPMPITNFMADTSRFKVDMEINMPLSGRIGKIIFQDTIQFRFQEVNELQSLSLITYFKNGFPLEANVQVYFADSLGLVIDSLMQNNQILMPGAPVNIAGRVTGPTENTTEINYPAAKIANLSKVRKVYVKATTATSTYQNNPNTIVKIYGDYRLEVKISGRAKLKFKI